MIVCEIYYIIQPTFLYIFEIFYNEKLKEEKISHIEILLKIKSKQASTNSRKLKSYQAFSPTIRD